MNDYIPLSKREQGVLEMPLSSEIPVGAVSRFREFFESSLRLDEWDSVGQTLDAATARRIESTVNIPNPAPTGKRDSFVVEWVSNQIYSDDLQSIDILEALAHYKFTSEQEAASLNEIFAESYMVWRAVKSEGDTYRFERRVSAESEAALASLSANSSAAAHMRQAWHALYGRKPNPTEAYAEAIKAIEACAGAIVSPNNTQATLGTILGSLRAQNPSITSSSMISSNSGKTDSDVALDVMQMLWQTQQRHGSEDANSDRPMTGQEAEMAVHQALWLVHCFQSGLLRV